MWPCRTARSCRPPATPGRSVRNPPRRSTARPGCTRRRRPHRSGSGRLDLPPVKASHCRTVPSDEVVTSAFRLGGTRRRVRGSRARDTWRAAPLLDPTGTPSGRRRPWRAVPSGLKAKSQRPSRWPSQTAVCLPDFASNTFSRTQPLSGRAHASRVPSGLTTTGLGSSRPGTSLDKQPGRPRRVNRWSSSRATTRPAVPGASV